MPKSRSKRSSTTGPAAKRIYGPVAFAIDGKDDTAWGIDAGPGRRNQPRKAVFIPDKPLTFTNGVDPYFPPQAKSWRLEFR